MVFINRNVIKIKLRKNIHLQNKSNNLFSFSGKKYQHSVKITLLGVFLNIFGISLKRFSRYFSARFGNAMNTPILFIGVSVFHRLQLMFQKLYVNYELKKMISANLNLKRKLALYQGYRLGVLFLPIRGQRTKTNAQTVKNIKKNSIKKDSKRVRKRGNKKGK